MPPQVLGVRQTTNNSKLAADGGQIVKMHLETYYANWKGIERLFTWKQSSEPVQRTSLVRLPVTGMRRPYPIPNLAGSKAAVEERKALERNGQLVAPRRIFLQGQAGSLEGGSSQAVGLHGALLPVAELLQVRVGRGGAGRGS